MSIEHCKLDRTSFEAVRISAYKATSVGRKPVPRIVRKWLARTNIHRAWLQGHTGSFLLPVLERN
ncbi:hypothetical protein ACNO5E_22755 [Vibrio parahaemolyticus]|uniref:hypothetical protein n=1 Tax=Vibrio parahaemolyticus TaxID=670 RepID=UPI001111D811|nr:hypothetical protein [Vibrio parahaemolyticus]